MVAVLVRLAGVRPAFTTLQNKVVNAGLTPPPTRQLLVKQRRLGRHLAGQIVGQSVHLDLAAGRLRILPAKIVRPSAGLDVFPDCH